MEILLPPSGHGQGVVLAHAWWGLNEDIRQYGARLAREGFVVALPDLFEGRIATEIAEAETLADTDWIPNPGDRLRDAIAFLAQHPAVAPDGISAVGFSYSGWHLLGIASGAGSVLRRAVIYYATRQLGREHAPVLVHFAADDPFEEAEDMRSMAQGLAADGTGSASHSYAGTRHWFAEPSRPEHDNDAAELAFQRTVRFLRG